LDDPNKKMISSRIISLKQ